jgi:hypothetical protein
MGATDNFRLLCFIKSLLFLMRGRNAASPKFPQTALLSSPVTPNLHQMASFIKRGETWRAQVRRRGHKAVNATFPTKAQAQAWARKIEAEMDARRFMDARGLANITLKERIDWYSEEIGGAHPFGKNKKAVLRIWRATMATSAWTS